jgi:hypothetical protein
MRRHDENRIRQDSCSLICVDRYGLKSNVDIAPVTDCGA